MRKIIIYQLWQYECWWSHKVWLRCLTSFSLTKELVASSRRTRTGAGADLHWGQVLRNSSSVYDCWMSLSTGAQTKALTNNDKVMTSDTVRCIFFAVIGEYQSKCTQLCMWSRTAMPRWGKLSKKSRKKSAFFDWFIQGNNDARGKKKLWKYLHFLPRKRASPGERFSVV